MRTGADTLLATIPMGTYPLEMAISASKQELYVICQEDINPIYPTYRGSVYVVDLNTYAIKRKLYERFFQPHGIAVDEQLIFSCNRFESIYY